MPMHVMLPIKAHPASRLPTTAPIRRALPTFRADGNPARGGLLNRKTMANAHLESGLRGINRLHLSPKTRAMTLPLTQHQIHPGMNHFMTKSALGGRPMQKIIQGLLKHNLPSMRGSHRLPAAIKARRLAHPPITPAQSNQRARAPHKAAIKVFSIEPVKQRQQGLKGHGDCERSQTGRKPAQSASFLHPVSQNLHLFGCIRWN